jgi:hypothetical protein
MSLLSAQRGTASVEIAVMLPLFALLIASVLYLHSVGTAALSVHERARGCAWQYAVSGCQASAQGKGLCRDVLALPSDKIAHSASAAQSETSALSDKIADVPVIGELWESIFGEGAIAQAKQTTPRLLEDGEQSLQTSYYMVCNTVSKSWAQIRAEQLCGFASKLNIPAALVGCK